MNKVFLLTTANMTKSEFCWWLHGWIEIQNPENISEEQVKEIKNHLHITINPIDPNSWYPENLRRYNIENPGKELAC